MAPRSEDRSSARLRRRERGLPAKLPRVLPRIALSLLAAPLLALAQSGAASGPRVVLEAADGKLTTHSLATFRTTDPRELGGHLVRFEGLPEVELPASDSGRALVELVGGARAFGQVVGGDGESLSLALIGGAPLAVPIDALRSIVFPARIPEDSATPLEPAALGDRLYLLRTGGLDRIDGAVEAFTREGVRLESSLGSRLYRWEELGALYVEVLEGGDGAAAAPEGVSVTVDLADGSRVSGGLAMLDGDGVRLGLAAGTQVTLPLAVVAELLVEDGRLRFLSELEPDTAVDSSPFGDELGMRWPHRRDRSVTGGPLRAGGRLYTRGIGVHAPSLLGWKLDGEWKELRGRVAIDDEVLRLNARGSVRFRVLADGQLRWESPVLRGGDPPLDIPPVALSGVRELVFEVDQASDLHVADRADWLRVLLRR